MTPDILTPDAAIVAQDPETASNGLSNGNGTPDAKPNPLEAAIRAAELGFSVIPVDPATKKAFGAWSHAQTERATPGEIAKRANLKSFAVIGGAVSGGVDKDGIQLYQASLDFDVDGFFKAWRAETGDLSDGLTIQRTGGGGYQVLFKSPIPLRNDKFAYALKPEADDGREVAIESRGEGGYFVVAPSLHPSGERYKWIEGDLSSVPVISSARAHALIDAAKRLDKAPFTKQQLEQQEQRANRATVKLRATNPAGGSVIDAFNATNSIEQTLEGFGYIRRGERFSRPGGTDPSVVILDGKSFHHASNDALNDGYSHTAFSIFCALDHGDDVKAAVKAAAAELGLDSDANRCAILSSSKHPAPEDTKEKEPFEFRFSMDSALDDCLSDIEWLWPGYIPKGFPTMIAAEQGHGKSTVAQSLIQALIQGHKWPDGQDTPILPKDQKMLWIDTEGGLAMFRQRLRDWGMPRDRFIFPEDPLKELMLDDARDWQWIEAAIEQFSPPVIVFDSLSGSHRGEENSNDNMKMILKRVAELAQRRKIAPILIHHLNKAPFGVPEYPITLNRLRGASSITQFCRSVIALGTPDKEHPENRRLDVIKMNLAPMPKPVGYVLTDRGPAWGNAPEVPQPRRAADDAAEFLLDFLADGMKESDEIKAAASAKGIGLNSLKSAKKALNITAKHEGGKNGRWFWALPSTPYEEEVI